MLYFLSAQIRLIGKGFLMAGTMKDNEFEFRDWLRNQYTNDGLRRYTDNAIVVSDSQPKSLAVLIVIYTESTVRFLNS